MLHKTTTLKVEMYQETKVELLQLIFYKIHIKGLKYFQRKRIKCPLGPSNTKMAILTLGGTVTSPMSGHENQLISGLGTIFSSTQNCSHRPENPCATQIWAVSGPGSSQLSAHLMPQLTRLVLILENISVAKFCACFFLSSDE